MDKPAIDAEGATLEGPQFVDLNTITDADQLREVMRNPEKFTTEVPEAPPETEEIEEKPPEEEPAPEEAAPRNRVKVRIAHLPESQKSVLTLVSKGATIHAAQSEVVAALVREGKSLREAEADVYGEGGRRAVDAPEAKPAAKPETLPDAADPVAAKQAEVDGIKAEMAEAKANYDVAKIEELRDRLDDARWELRDLKDVQKTVVQTREQEETQAVVNLIAESTKTAIELFPDAEVEGSELFEAIQDEVEDLRESNPDFFLNPRWPIILAAEKAALLGIPSSKHKGGVTLPLVERVPTAKRRALNPASGTSGGSVNKPSEPANPQAELEAAGTDPAKLNAWLRRYGRREVGPGSMAESFIAA